MIFHLRHYCEWLRRLCAVEYRLYRFPGIDEILLRTFDHVSNGSGQQHLPVLRKSFRKMKLSGDDFYHPHSLHPHVALEILDDVFRHQPFRTNMILIYQQTILICFTRSRSFIRKTMDCGSRVATSIALPETLQYRFLRFNFHISVGNNAKKIVDARILKVINQSWRL